MIETFMHSISYTSIVKLGTFGYMFPFYARQITYQNCTVQISCVAQSITICCIYISYSIFLKDWIVILDTWFYERLFISNIFSNLSYVSM